MLEALRYPFVIHALLAGACVAVSAAACGYFLVARGLAFAAHALPNIGFAGAAGAVLAGIDPLFGMFGFTLAAAAAMGLVPPGRTLRDVGIGVFMTFALGLGLLFLALYRGYAERVYAILFGTVLGISTNDVVLTAAGSAAVCAALLFISRPLLYSTHDPGAAEAKGVPVRALSVAFLLILAVATSLSVVVMGSLLVFALLVGPAATAARLVVRPLAVMALAGGLGVLYVVLSILIAAAVGSLPVSFLVASLSFAVYLPVRLATRASGET